MKSLPNAPAKPNISDIFTESDNDYDEENAADAWQIHNTSLLLGSSYNKVGIGVTNPTTDLDVAGDINFTGNLTQNGVAFSSFTSSDVVSVLSTSGGTGITWNSTTNKFDNDITQYQDSDVVSVLSSKGGTGITWNSTTNKFDNDITQYQDSDVVSVLSTSGGTGITWNSTTNKFDNDITQYQDSDVVSVLSSKGGTGITWNSTTNKFDNDITQYQDSDVVSVLSSKGGTGITWNSTTNKFDNDITQYQDSDVVSVLSSKGGTGIVWNSSTSKFDLDNNVTISNNLTVSGDLNVVGEFYNVNTEVKVTDQFKITNAGTGPALIVNQTGTNPIVEFQDDGTNVFTIVNGGNVGIGVASPAEKLDVNGYINAVSGYKVGGNNINFTHIGGTLGIAAGGTGGASAADARANLGLTDLLANNTTDVTLASVTDNYLSIDENTQVITAGQVPISLGGTGAASAADARANLGLTSLYDNNTTDVTLASVTDNYLSIDENTQVITAGQVPISLGGTGAASATAAIANLGLTDLLANNTTDVTLASVTDNYLSIDENTQVITAGQVPISLGGTGAASAADARANLGLTSLYDNNTTDVTLASVTDNYLSIDENTQVITAGQVPISLGGTGAASATAAIANLGLTSLYDNNTTDVTLASVTDNYLSIDENTQVITAGQVPISLGGTGAASAAAAIANLGLTSLYDNNTTDVTLASVTDNYLSIDENTQVITAGQVPISLGGTGAASAADARANLGLTSLYDNNTTDVTLASVTDNYLSIDENTQVITAGQVPISLGGTGASTQTGAANNILPSVTTGHYLKFDGTNWVGSEVQASGGGGGGSSLWSEITNTSVSSIYYDSNVKIGGDIAVEPAAALEINGNLVVTGTIISGWNGDIDSDLTTSGGGKWELIGDTDDLYYSSNVKIGGDEEVTPVAKLEVNGDIVATGDITAGYSDDRLKDYISNIENPIDIIKSLNGYYFKPNELANSIGYTNKEKEVGVSAQEVKSVLPEIVKIAPFDSMRNLDNELVSKSGSNYLTVNYERMAPLFIEAIKVLNDKIDSMTTELNSLKEFKESVLNQQNP